MSVNLCVEVVQLIVVDIFVISYFNGFVLFVGIELDSVLNSLELCIFEIICKSNTSFYADMKARDSKDIVGFDALPESYGGMSSQRKVISIQQTRLNVLYISA